MAGLIFFLLLFFFLPLLFFFLSLFLVGRDDFRRCSRGSAVNIAVLFGRDHDRRGCERVHDSGHGHGGLV